MRNLVTGAIFGVVTGVVIGATLLGPQMVKQIPGFAKPAVAPDAIPQPASAAPEPTAAAPVVAKQAVSKPAVLKPQIKPEPATGNQPAIRWRMASAYSSSLPQLGGLAKRVEHQIDRLSGGTFKIKLHEPGTLVAPDQMLDAVKSGTIEAAFGSPGLWAAEIPALNLYSAIPFGPSPQEYMAWFYFSDGQKSYQEIYHAQGIHGLICGMAAPEASGWFKKKIETTDDLIGLRMRIGGLGAKVMAKQGVETRAIADADVFVAFEAGTLDAAEFSQPAIDLKLGLHKMADNYYFPGWHQPTSLFEVLINLDSWQALSAKQQSQISTICGDNVRYSLAQSEFAQFEALKELVRLEVNLQSWPAKVLEKLRESWAGVVAEEAQKDKDFERVWRSLVKFREEFEIWQELSAR